MMKHKKLFIPFILLSTIPLNAQESELDMIVRKYFDTIGQDKVIKIETAIASGITIRDGEETSFKQVQKRPNKAYLEVLLSDGQILKQGYDGEIGWMQASWMGASEPVELTGPDLKTIKEMGNIEGDLWNWREKGHKLTLIGYEELKGKQVYHIKLVKSDGDIDELYIDKDNYILHKMVRKTEIEGSEVEVEILFDDYRNIEGMLLPFLVEQLFNGEPGMTVKIKDIRFNIDIDDKIFTKPD